MPSEFRILMCIHSGREEAEGWKIIIRSLTRATFEYFMRSKYHKIAILHYKMKLVQQAVKKLRRDANDYVDAACMSFWSWEEIEE